MKRVLLTNRNRGFTLIEMLTVVIIIGILFVVLIPRINFMTDSAKVAGVKTTMRSVQASMDTFQMTNTRLPKVADFNKTSDIQFGTNGQLGEESPLANTTDTSVTPNLLIESYVSYSINQLDPWDRPYIMVREEVTPVNAGVPIGASKVTKIAVLSRGADGIMMPDPITTPGDDVVILFLDN